MMSRIRVSLRISWMLLVASMLSLILVSTGATIANAAGTGDDYPANLKAAAMDSLVDPWDFFNRECTSFVAWRLNQQSGRTSSPWAFSNNMTGPNGTAVHFGNAYEWKAAASKGGWRVDTNPSVGAVAFWSSGHVAIVTAVNPDGTANIEEYNYFYTGTYHTRSSVRADSYLHIADAEGRYVVVRDSANVLWGKEALNGPWTKLGSSDGALVVSGTRIAYRNTNGDVWAKDGLLGSWYKLYTGTKGFDS